MEDIQEWMWERSGTEYSRQKIKAALYAIESPHNATEVPSEIVEVVSNALDALDAIYTAAAGEGPVPFGV
jgi:hypothetical protein